MPSWRRERRKCEVQRQSRWGLLLLFVCTAPTLHIAKCDPDKRPIEGTVLKGAMDIGGKKFTATCDCRPPERAPVASGTAVLCNPAKISIMSDHGTVGPTPEVVRKLYGQPRDIAMVEVPGRMLACMDDRVTEPNLMTPGGDLGEFLLAVHILSTLVPPDQPPRRFSDDDVLGLLGRYVQRTPPSRPFYHCNDDLSVARMEKDIGIVGLDLTAPPVTQRPTLRERLTRLENHGDVHLRAILSHPERYHVPSTLPGAVISAFYRSLWDDASPIKPRLLLDLLPGARNPQVFLEIDEGEACTLAQKSPLVRPNVVRDTQAVSALVVHTAAASHRRRELAEFIQTELGGAGGLNTTADDIYHRLEKYGLQWLEATVALSVSPDVRFYRLMFL